MKKKWLVLPAVLLVLGGILMTACRGPETVTIRLPFADWELSIEDVSTDQYGEPNVTTGHIMVTFFRDGQPVDLKEFPSEIVRVGGAADKDGSPVKSGQKWRIPLKNVQTGRARVEIINNEIGIRPGVQFVNVYKKTVVFWTITGQDLARIRAAYNQNQASILEVTFFTPESAPDTDRSGATVGFIGNWENPEKFYPLLAPDFQQKGVNYIASVYNHTGAVIESIYIKWLMDAIGDGDTLFIRTDMESGDEYRGFEINLNETATEPSIEPPKPPEKPARQPKDGFNFIKEINFLQGSSPDAFTGRGDIVTDFGVIRSAKYHSYLRVYIYNTDGYTSVPGEIGGVPLPPAPNQPLFIEDVYVPDVLDLIGFNNRIPVDIWGGCKIALIELWEGIPLKSVELLRVRGSSYQGGFDGVFDATPVWGDEYTLEIDFSTNREIDPLIMFVGAFGLEEEIDFATGEKASIWTKISPEYTLGTIWEGSMAGQKLVFTIRINVAPDKIPPPEKWNLVFETTNILAGEFTIDVWEYTFVKTKTGTGPPPEVTNGYIFNNGTFATGVENSYLYYSLPVNETKPGTVTLNANNITVTHSDGKNTWDDANTVGYYRVRFDMPGTFDVSKFNTITINWSGITDNVSLEYLNIQVQLLDETGTTPKRDSNGEDYWTNQYVVQLEQRNSSSNGNNSTSRSIDQFATWGHTKENFSGTVYAVELVVNYIRYNNNQVFPVSRWQPWVIRSIQFH
jgi:hypothetical protein